MKRSEARESAFLLLFENTFYDGDYESLSENAKTYREMESDGYTKELFDGVVSNLKSIDAIIDTYSNKWKSSRLPRVAITALRIAIFEMEKFGKADAPIYINEAVELIKKYDTPESAKYANGILGSYVGKD